MTGVDGRVLVGDCRDRMAALPECSVDAVVTDPPYGLEFMGVAWDTMRDDGQPRARNEWGDFGTREHARHPSEVQHVLRKKNLAFGEFSAAWAAEAFRVLKPGGHLVAFGGSRTWHRLASAIEDAGFEVRDSLMWVYGCLTDDAEVLTAEGWRRGVEVRAGDVVAQWDAADESITLAPVQRTFLAPWAGPMRVLRNHDTDQMLTPNHRVWHRTRTRKMTATVRRSWYEDGWTVAEAAEVTRNQSTRLPLSGYHDGTGIGGEDYAALLGWVWTEGGFDCTKGSRGVRIYQSATANPTKTADIDLLLKRLDLPHKRYERTRTYKDREYVEVCWFFSGDFAERVRADLPGKHPTWPLLWRMAQKEKLAFYEAAMAGDGSGMAFYQADAADREWFITLLATIGKRGREGAKSEVAIANLGRTELQCRHFQAAPDEHYEGLVWCVQVPTGAFIARRRGKVFVTGNSGFPKSLDVSKAIDKHYGRIHSSVVRLKEMLREEFEASDKPRSQIDAECGFRASNYLTVPAEGKRPDPWANVLPSQAKWQQIKQVLGLADSPRVGTLDAAFAEAEREVVGVRRVAPGVAFSSQGPTELDITAPATPEAEQWDGWGTALKPAFEPIVLARKPLMGSVATNVLAHGTGALNIDGCRIDTDGEQVWVHRAGNGAVVGLGTEDSMERYQPGDAAKGDRGGRWPANLVLDGEAADLLDEQTGVLKSGANATRRSSDKFATVYGDFEGQAECVAHRGADEGGASRFFYVAKADEDERPVVDGVAHPTVKPLALMRWLIRLVTPPGGVVLDPFLGSGTTAEAALLEGFDWLGCERTEDYLPLIQARLDRFAAGRSPGLPQPRVRPQVPGQIDLFSAAEEGAA